MRSKMVKNRLSLSIIGSAVLYLFALGLIIAPAKSFWLDEIASIQLAKNWSSMIGTSLQSEGNMWLYYLILHFWLKLGETELIVRLLSVLFACFTIPVVYLIGKKLFGEVAGRISVLLLSMNLFFIAYSQEARSYSLFLFLTALSTYFFLLFREKQKILYFLAYVICSVLAVYAHIFSIFFLIAQFFSLLFDRRKSTLLKRFFVSAVSMNILLLPMLLAPSFRSHPIDWIQHIDFRNGIAFFLALSGDNPVLLVMYFVLFLFILKKIYPAPAWCGIKKWEYAFLLSLLLIPPGIAFTYSFLIKPIVTSKYLICCLTPFVLLAASSLAEVRSKRVFTILLLLIFVFSSIRQYAWVSGGNAFSWVINNNKDDWRGIASYIAQQGKPHDVIIFYSYFIKEPFDFYWDKSKNFPNAMNVHVLDVSSNTSFHETGITLPEPDIRLIDSFPSHYSRVWLVLSNTDFAIPGRFAQKTRIQNALMRHYKLERKIMFGNIAVCSFVLQ